MLVVILVGLAVAIIAGTVLAGVAFFDVAFAGAPQKSGCGCQGCGGCGRSKSDAREIAALVQRSLPRADVDRIRNWSKRHARVSANAVLCPLMADDGSCVVFAEQAPVETAL